MLNCQIITFSGTKRTRRSFTLVFELIECLRSMRLSECPWLDDPCRSMLVIVPAMDRSCDALGVMFFEFPEISEDGSLAMASGDDELKPKFG